MVRTRVGYAGGQKLSPTYHDLGDHAEAIQIDYDPSRLSYEDLLEIFWHSHSPLQPAWKRQYMSAIFVHDETQKRLAEETKAQQAERLGAEIHTEISEVTEFYSAEDYHQKYMLGRHGDLLEELSARYPRFEDLVDSTAAARINGYAAGCGRVEDLEAEIGDYGLSPAATTKLLKISRDRRRYR